MNEKDSSFSGDDLEGIEDFRAIGVKEAYLDADTVSIVSDVCDEGLDKMTVGLLDSGALNRTCLFCTLWSKERFLEGLE